MKTSIALLLLVPHVVSTLAGAAEPQLKIGVIGLDTSHSIAFTKELNNAERRQELANCRVVAAYPKGSPDIESSVSRVPEYTEDVKKLGVEIVDSIDELLKRVDCVLLETNDGRPHLEQALPCFKAGKPTFIDKPIAGVAGGRDRDFRGRQEVQLPDVLVVVAAVWQADAGRSRRLDRRGQPGAKPPAPRAWKRRIPDLFWYGIHGVESLFTVMGTGCETATRKTTADGKIEVVGEWVGGRIGTYREDKGYGGKASRREGRSPGRQLRRLSPADRRDRQVLPHAPAAGR